MPDRRRLWGRLGVLAAAVLALHLWLLGGLPRVLGPAPSATPWNARHIAPPVAIPAPIAAPVQPAPPPAPKPAAHSRQPLARANLASASPAGTPQVSGPASPPAEPVQRFRVPAPARLHYLVTTSVRGATSEGQAELQWRHDSRGYEAQWTTEVPGLRPRVQRSTGQITAQGLVPQRFSDKSRQEEAAHFDRDAGKLSFSSNRPAADLAPGAQDRLSVILQLGAMLAADAGKFPAGASIAIQTASAREAQPWVFVVEGVETLSLPGGAMPALRLSRTPTGPYDAKLELWLAPGAAYAPVRLRLTQPTGDWVDQLWSSTDSGE